MKVADSRLLVGLVLSLLVSSLCISFITDTEAAQLGDTVLYRPVDADFGNPETTDINATKIYEVVTGGWIGTEDGLITTQPGENVLHLMVLNPVGGRYENTYSIRNPDGRTYKIIVRDTSLWSDSLRLKMSPGYVTIESKSLLGSYGYQATKPYGVAAYGTDYTVKTVLHEEDRTVDVWIDDTFVGRFANVPEDGVFSIGPSTYSGLVVEGAGFVFKGFVSSAERLEAETFDIWAFINSFAGVLGWYTSSGNYTLDLFINLIIKIQQFGIIVVAVTIIRGN